MTCQPLKKTPQTPAGEIEGHIRAILKLIGEDPGREGLRDTPKRFAKAILDLSSGYDADFDKIMNGAVFSQTHSGLVLVRDIEIFSLCEHHLLPFYGKAHVAYVPDGKVVGLSKIPRMVDAFARRLQIQEKLSYEIAAELMERLAPKGVAIMIEAFHMCMMMRGVEKQGCSTVTSAFLGVFEHDAELRRELRDVLKASGQ